MTTNFSIPATIAFIQEAHAGQKYGTMPYFLHPVEVAAEANTIYDTLLTTTTLPDVTDVQVAALLHDVIEDTNYTAEMLRERFNDNVIAMVELLTKDETLSYAENIQRIQDSENVGAMIVKLADNRINRNGQKPSWMAPVRANRLNARYDASIIALTNTLAKFGIRVYG
jgi:(p)ppGpp synthase/HD superfamily hydrolase